MAALNDATQNLVAASDLIDPAEIVGVAQEIRRGIQSVTVIMDKIAEARGHVAQVGGRAEAEIAPMLTGLLNRLTEGRERLLATCDDVQQQSGLASTAESACDQWARQIAG